MQNLLNKPAFEGYSFGETKFADDNKKTRALTATWCIERLSQTHHLSYIFMTLKMRCHA